MEAVLRGTPSLLCPELQGVDGDCLGGNELPPEGVSHVAHVWPVETAPAEEHVSDEGFYRCLPYEPHEEQLLYDL